MERYGEIYIITNKINGKQYIGQTTSFTKNRWVQHVQEANSNRNDYAVTRAIRKYGVDGFDVQTFCSCFGREQLDLIEANLIASAGTLAPYGYNLRAGGSGHTFCQETKDKMRIAKLGRPQTAEAIENHAKALRGKKRPGSGKKTAERLGVPVVDHTGKVYPSASAAARETGCPISCIIRVLHGELPQIREFSFARVSDGIIPVYDPSRPRGQNRSKESRKKMAETKQIPIVDQNGKIYSSTKEAASLLGCSTSAISKVLCGHNKTAKGFSFKYVGKDSK